MKREKNDINYEYATLDIKNTVTDLLKFKKYKNQKIVIIGVNPLGDFSYLIDLIINYDEIYIGYYNVRDLSNLKDMLKKLINFISNPIHSFYYPEMSIAINRITICKFYFFKTIKLNNLI